MIKTRRKAVLATAICLLACIPVIVGVSAMASKSWSARIGEGRRGWNEAGDLMGRLRSQYHVGIQELTPYDYETFRFYYGARNGIVDADAQIHTLQQFNEVLPVELLKPIDDDTLCVVYRLETKDEDTALAYVLFERETTYFDRKDGVDQAGHFEIWQKTGEIYYVSEARAEASFSNVRIGDSLSSVIDLDPSVRFDADYHTVSPTHVGVVSYRLLTDGVLILTFEAPKDPDATLMPDLSAYTLTGRTFYAYEAGNAPSHVSLAKVSSLLASD